MSHQFENVLQTQSDVFCISEKNSKDKEAIKRVSTPKDAQTRNVKLDFDSPLKIADNEIDGGS